MNWKKNGLNLNRLISGNKTLYRNRFPKNFVCFNANIFADGIGKVWWGDIDITQDHKKILQVASNLKIKLYILYEMDGRFENVNRDDFKVVSIWNTDTGLGEKMKKYYTPKTLKLRKEFNI